MASTAETRIDERRNDPLRSAWRKSYAGLTAVGLFSVFINILRLATPMYVLQLLDRVIASRSVETLLMLSIITLTAIVVGVALDVIRRRMFVHWGNWIERRFGPTLFTAGLKHGATKSPTTSKALRDLATIRSFVSGSALIAWLDVWWAPLFIGVILLISWQLGLIVLLLCLVTLALGTVNEMATRDSRDAGYEARKDDRAWIASAERNRESLGSHNMVANFARRWSRSAFARIDESTRTRTTTIYFTSAMRLVGRCLRIAVIGVGIWLVIEEVLTLGAVVAANVLGRTAYMLVQTAMLKWRDMMTARRAYARVREALNKHSVARVSLPAAATTQDPLTIENVSYRYSKQANAIFRGVNLTLQPGELLAVIGPSATGKSTFTRLAAGLLMPRAGKIRLGDVDVYRLAQTSTRREIGLLPQDYTLFQGSVRENIARMTEGDIGQVVRAARLAGIHDTVLRLPRGYDTEISEHEPLLSSGQRKGVALARAFYGSPPLVVMDEPMPHLDRKARSALLKGIGQLQSEGTIVILTTQSKSQARTADKAIVFSNGRHEVLRSREQVAALRRRRSSKRDGSSSASKKSGTSA